MHELAIADAVLTMALEQAPDRRVARVGMRIGHLRQVVPSSLRFSFALVARETPAAGAVLEIEEVPVSVRCARCDVESAPRGFPLTCGWCGDMSVRVTRGDEMLVEWIETDSLQVEG
ncbi:MAG TPA: hydrogenase maturation nickel metallochaperone HypA [Gemmatimonadaceae bacterium]|nr:hydrogenase maturation nickel metallochaperone HypA [Gemmatimonadaceae bacterium]